MAGPAGLVRLMSSPSAVDGLSQLAKSDWNTTDGIQRPPLGGLEVGDRLELLPQRLYWR